MGIKYLNRFFMDNCTNRAIRKLNLKYLENKTLVIDTSIYLYKFAEKNTVIENMYLMISVFRAYNITPIFVFDGKPPIEKKALLIQRRQDKIAAELKYNELKKESEDHPSWETAKTLDSLKKQFVRVSDADIQGSKALMKAYGITYFESSGESDQLCAYLVAHNYAWACVSDDMDMFLYGCPRVLRHVSLLYHEAVFYDTPKILSDLDMTPEVFSDIAILSGTDYNIQENRNLSELVGYYSKYREYAHYNCANAIDFRSWLIQNTSCIDDLEKLETLSKMFDLDFYSETNRPEIKRIVDCLPFRLGGYRVEDLAEVLRDDGFLFCNS